MTTRQSRAMVLGAGALVVGHGISQAFVAAPVVSSSLRGTHAAAARGVSGNEAPWSFGAAAGAAALLTAAVGGRAAMVSVTALSAAATKKKKKKGVRVVEGKEIPWNLFSPKKPFAATVVSTETITERTEMPNWETVHTIYNHKGEMPYVEGQSIGVVAPGPDKKGEKPAKIRLYSIASSSPGDDETGKTVSLVVKRVLEVEGMGWAKYFNRENDPEFPGKNIYRGVCSTHICDTKAGDEVLLTGPVGAEMLLPEDPDANVIMWATGTGIAPFRSHLRHLFHDKASKGKFNGLAWLFLGVPYAESILYDEEWKAMQKEHPEQFRYDYAVSNDHSPLNKINGQMWVQHRAMEFAEELWKILKSEKTHVYMCGLKGMEAGLAECFQPLAEKEGIDWAEFVKSMKKGHRYHVEVY